MLGAVRPRFLIAGGIFSGARRSVRLQKLDRTDKDCDTKKSLVWLATSAPQTTRLPHRHAAVRPGVCGQTKRKSQDCSHLLKC
jgi:hypothetical protein